MIVDCDDVDAAAVAAAGAEAAVVSTSEDSEKDLVRLARPKSGDPKRVIGEVGRRAAPNTGLTF